MAFSTILRKEVRDWTIPSMITMGICPGCVVMQDGCYLKLHFRQTAVPDLNACSNTLRSTKQRASQLYSKSFLKWFSRPYNSSDTTYSSLRNSTLKDLTPISFFRIQTEVTMKKRRGQLHLGALQFPALQQRRPPRKDGQHPFLPRSHLSLGRDTPSRSAPSS